MPSTPLSPDLPGLRLVKVPDAAPPYDCETHGAVCPAARNAAETGQHTSGRALPPADLLAPAARDLLAPAARDLLAPAAELPRTLDNAPDSAWTRQFAQVIVEILAGSRPLRQTVPWTTDRVRAQIGLLVPLLASDRRPRIQRIVTSRPTARVVEMTVVVGFGPRSRALAMRFEHMPARQAAPGLPARPARWLCTEIEAG